MPHPTDKPLSDIISAESIAKMQPDETLAARFAAQEQRIKELEVELRNCDEGTKPHGRNGPAGSMKIADKGGANDGGY